MDNVLKMRMSEGAAGYGIFMMLLELLRDSDDYKTKYDPVVLAWALHEPDVKKLTSVCESYGLFEISPDQEIYCPWLTSVMASHTEKSRKLSEAGKKSAAVRALKANNSDATPEPVDNHPATTLGGGGQGGSNVVDLQPQQNKRKETKTKETKSNAPSGSVLAVDDVWSDEFIAEIGKSKGDAFILEDSVLKHRCDREHNVYPIADVARTYKLTTLQYTILERACNYGKIGSPELIALLKLREKCKNDGFKPLYAFEYFMKQIRKEVGR